MRRSVLRLSCFIVLALGPWSARAQGRDSVVTMIPAPRLEAFARAHLAIDSLRDRAHARFAEPKNKKTEVQVQLREQLRSDVMRVLKDHQLSQAEYDRFTMIVSADSSQRRLFDSTITTLTTKSPPR